MTIEGTQEQLTQLLDAIVFTLNWDDDHPEFKEENDHEHLISWRAMIELQLHRSCVKSYSAGNIKFCEHYQENAAKCFYCSKPK